MKITGTTVTMERGWEAEVTVDDDFAYTETGDTEVEAKLAAEAVALASALGQIRWEMP